MDFRAGHLEHERIVHLSARSFFVDAFCGETVAFDGEPDIAVICDDCHALAVDAGGDAAGWMVEVRMLELRQAA